MVRRPELNARSRHKKILVMMNQAPDHNPFAPPKSTVDATIEVLDGVTPRPDTGVRLGASILWRVLALQMVMTRLLGYLVDQLTLFDHNTLLVWWLPISSGLMGAILGGSLWFMRFGLFYLIWGHRLRVSQSFFKRFGRAVCGLYLLLAGINGGVALLTLPQFYFEFRMLSDFVGILTLSFVVAPWLARAYPYGQAEHGHAD